MKKAINEMHTEVNEVVRRQSEVGNYDVGKHEDNLEHGACERSMTKRVSETG